MDSKSARRRNRQNNFGCEEGSIGQQAFDKILRSEGRLGTLHQKFIDSVDEVHELRGRVAMLEKLLLFIDVDKLNDAIKLFVDEDSLVKAHETDSSLTQILEQPSTPTRQLKLHEVLEVTPEKTKQTKILDMTSVDTTKFDETLQDLHDSPSVLASTEALTSEDFDALQAQVEELSESESERFYHEVSRFVIPCEPSGELELDITASNYRQSVEESPLPTFDPDLRQSGCEQSVDPDPFQDNLPHC